MVVVMDVLVVDGDGDGGDDGDVISVENSACK